jgi:hypothetical protein
MTFYKFLISFLPIALLFTSCEKEIDLNLDTGTTKLVIEGVIETNELPYVTITNSIAFFSKIDLSKVSYIKNAKVSIDDMTENKSIQLKEYSIDTVIDNQPFSFIGYYPDITDPIAMNFKGKVNHSYKLHIEANGNVYDAVTSIPFATSLDSLWTVPVIGKEDSFSIFKAMYDDPDTLGNCVRIETKVKRYQKTSEPEQFYTSDNAVYDDDVINGIRFPVTIDIGYDKSRTITTADYENLYYLRKGDTVTLKWSAIDRNTFHFWETLAFSKGSVGNPFASPTKVQGNIPGAIGVWAGYSPSYYTIIDSIK